MTWTFVGHEKEMHEIELDLVIWLVLCVCQISVGHDELIFHAFSACIDSRMLIHDST